MFIPFHVVSISPSLPHIHSCNKYPVTLPPTHPSSHPCVHSCIHVANHPFTQLIHPVFQLSSSYLSIRVFIHAIIHPFIHSCIHSFIQSFIHLQSLHSIQPHNIQCACVCFFHFQLRGFEWHLLIGHHGLYPLSYSDLTMQNVPSKRARARCSWGVTWRFSPGAVSGHICCLSFLERRSG